MHAINCIKLHLKSRLMKMTRFCFFPRNTEFSWRARLAVTVHHWHLHSRAGSGERLCRRSRLMTADDGWYVSFTHRRIGETMLCARTPSSWWPSTVDRRRSSSTSVGCRMLRDNGSGETTVASGVRRNPGGLAAPCRSVGDPDAQEFA